MRWGGSVDSRGEAEGHTGFRAEGRDYTTQGLHTGFRAESRGPATQGSGLRAGLKAGPAQPLPLISGAPSTLIQSSAHRPTYLPHPGRWEQVVVPRRGFLVYGVSSKREAKWATCWWMCREQSAKGCVEGLQRVCRGFGLQRVCRGFAEGA